MVEGLVRKESQAGVTATTLRDPYRGMQAGGPCPGVKASYNKYEPLIADDVGGMDAGWLPQHILLRHRLLAAVHVFFASFFCWVPSTLVGHHPGPRRSALALLYSLHTCLQAGVTLASAALLCAERPTPNSFWRGGSLPRRPAATTRRALPKPAKTPPAPHYHGSLLVCAWPSVSIVWKIQMSLCPICRQNHHPDHASRATVPLDGFL